MTKIVSVDKKKKNKQTAGNKSKSIGAKVFFKDYWTKTNSIILLTGFAVLILGFYLMSFGPWDNPTSLTFSPIVLLIAYLVIFPVAIFYRHKK